MEHTFACTAVCSSQGTMLVLRRSNENAVVCVCLDVLLQVLRPLERLAAEIALVRLQGDVNANVRGDVVALHSSCATRVPLAGQVQIVGALPAYVLLTEMVLVWLVSSDSGTVVGGISHRASPAC